MSNAIVSMDQMQQMAKALVTSKMFGFKTETEALSIMLIAQAEGRSPALAARDYHVIQGRPALKADAMLARFQQEGGIVEWKEYGDAKVSGAFSHPKSCPVPVVITWTIDMAKRIGLANRDNWRNYPRAMLRSRVISEGVRTVYPGVSVGIYTVEEVQDMAKEKDITPSTGVAEALSEEERVKVADLADRVREWLNGGSLGDAWAEMDNAALSAEEQIFLWTHFDSKVRRQLKEEGERQRIKAQKSLPAPATITDAQKKRLEAHIHALKVDRDAVKAYCKEQFGKDHFADLTNEEYETTYSQVEFMSLPSSAAQVASHHNAGPADSPAASSPASALPSDADLVSDIEKCVKKKDWDSAHDLCNSIKDKVLCEATRERITKAHKYVSDKAAV